MITTTATGVRVATGADAAAIAAIYGALGVVGGRATATTDPAS
jgi:hypothetical protein